MNDYKDKIQKVRQLKTNRTSEEAYDQMIKMNPLVYVADDQRHLVCKPYSIENLHRMAEELNIKRCWFHKDHYDIPKRRIEEIQGKCEIVSPKEIVRIIEGYEDPNFFKRKDGTIVAVRG